MSVAVSEAQAVEEAARGYLEIYGGIATAVVGSALYREYLHLARVGGEWRIVNAFYAAASERTTR